MKMDGTNRNDISGTTPFDDYPDWYGSSSSVVLVQDEEGTPVASAEVYTNTLGPGSPATFVGTTGSDGTLTLPDPVTNEYIIARSLVYTGTTSKGAHDGWAYHVWLTDIDQESDGTQSAYQIDDPSLMNSDRNPQPRQSVDRLQHRR